jgi:hypothetical protein
MPHQSKKSSNALQESQAKCCCSSLEGHAKVKGKQIAQVLMEKPCK